MAEARESGFYGKLPSKGDFVTRRLSRGFIDKWDGWLQQAIAHSKGALGEDWLDIYLTSPIWNFVMTPGVCGARGWGGVMMHSVDRVGRYFPLTIAGSMGEECDPLGTALVAQDWFEKAGNVALLALEDGDNAFQDFDLGVAALGEPREGRENTPRLQADPFAIGQDWMISLAPGASLGSGAATLLSQILADRFDVYSIWWTEGSHDVGPCMLVCRGLPPPESYASLISGQLDATRYVELFDMPCPASGDVAATTQSPDDGFFEITPAAAAVESAFESEVESEVESELESELESEVESAGAAREQEPDESHAPQALVSASTSGSGVVAGARPMSIDDFLAESATPPQPAEQKDPTVPRSGKESFGSVAAADAETEDEQDDNDNEDTAVPAAEPEEPGSSDGDESLTVPRESEGDTRPGYRNGDGSA